MVKISITKTSFKGVRARLHDTATAPLPSMATAL